MVTGPLEVRMMKCGANIGHRSTGNIGMEVAKQSQKENEFRPMFQACFWLQMTDI